MSQQPELWLCKRERAQSDVSDPDSSLNIVRFNLEVPDFNPEEKRPEIGPT
jgi:hypothetical protein